MDIDSINYHTIASPPRGALASSDVHTSNRILQHLYENTTFYYSKQLRLQISFTALRTRLVHTCILIFYNYKFNPSAF